MNCNQNYKHLQLNRGRYTEYIRENPVLKSGEASYVYVENLKFHILKIGDGTTHWKDLPCLRFDDPVPYTTPPPVCVDDNFLLLQGGYFDLSLRGVNIINSGSIESSEYTIPPSSYQFDFTQDGNSPHIVAEYGKKINPLGFDDFEVDFSFYLPSASGGNNTKYGKTFPFFTIGDDFSTCEPSGGEVSFSLLKTADNPQAGSISGTFLIFHSELLKASGLNVEILPSSWYNAHVDRINGLSSASISGQTLISYSPVMSGLDIGSGLLENNFLIGNSCFDVDESFDCYILSYRQSPCEIPPQEMPLIRNITTPERTMTLSIIFDTFEQDDSLDISYINSLGQEVFLLTTGFVSGSQLATAPDCDSPGSSPKIYTVSKPSGITSLKITVTNSQAQTNISGIYLSICDVSNIDGVQSFELQSNVHGGYCDGSNYVGNTLDTGLYLESGVSIKIEASGEFTIGCPSCPGQPFTPDGYIGGPLTQLDCVDEDFYSGQLMGKIGSSTFAAGSDIIIQTKDSGNLEFFILDDPIGDNNGSYYINISDVGVGSGTILIDNFKATKKCPQVSTTTTTTLSPVTTTTTTTIIPTTTTTTTSEPLSFALCDETSITGVKSGGGFGISSAISYDGNVVAAGGPYEDAPSDVNIGFVKIYENNGSAWQQKGSTLYGNLNVDWFGNDVDLNSDGTVVIIGVYHSSVVSSQMGYAIVYEWDNITNDWQQKGSRIDGDAANDWFGRKVAISEDGLKIAIASQDHNNNTGRVKVLTWDSNTSDWIIENTLDGENSGDRFGTSLKMYGSNGNEILLVGSQYFDNGVNSSVGKVYRYKWTSGSNTPTITSTVGQVANEYLGILADINTVSGEKTLLYSQANGADGTITIYDGAIDVNSATSIYTRQGNNSEQFGFIGGISNTNPMRIITGSLDRVSIFEIDMNGNQIATDATIPSDWGSSLVMSVCISRDGSRAVIGYGPPSSPGKIYIYNLNCSIATSTTTTTVGPTTTTTTTVTPTTTTTTASPESQLEVIFTRWS